MPNRGTAERLRIKSIPTLEDDLGVADRFDVRGGLSSDDDKGGKFAWFDTCQLALAAECRRRHQRGRTDRLDGGHAGLDQVFQFAVQAVSRRQCHHHRIGARDDDPAVLMHLADKRDLLCGRAQQAGVTNRIALARRCETLSLIGLRLGAEVAKPVGRDRRESRMQRLIGDDRRIDHHALFNDRGDERFDARAGEVEIGQRAITILSALRRGRIRAWRRCHAPTRRCPARSRAAVIEPRWAITWMPAR